jgi:hypothetical protein
MNKPGSAHHLESIDPTDSAMVDGKLDFERRQALLRLSRYAAGVAPAMLVLMSGKARAAPNCDNNGWHKGFSKNGHSPC